MGNRSGGNNAEKRLNTVFANDFAMHIFEGNVLHIGSWWRHQMETFPALLALCAANSPVSGEFPAKRPATRGFDFFFDLCLVKRLRKHSPCWWFETQSRPLWRHCNETASRHPCEKGLAICCIAVQKWLDVECFLTTLRYIQYTAPRKCWIRVWIRINGPVLSADLNNNHAYRNIL